MHILIKCISFSRALKKHNVFNPQGFFYQTSSVTIKDHLTIKDVNAIILFWAEITKYSNNGQGCKFTLRTEEIIVKKLNQKLYNLEQKKNMAKTTRRQKEKLKPALPCKTNWSRS